MRRHAFLLLAVLVGFLTACDVHHAKYVVHEETPLYAEPSDENPPIDVQPYSDKEPVVIRQLNLKRTFGLVKKKKKDDKRIEYWLPLTDINAVAPCGTTDPEEVCDQLVVVPKKLTIYARPEVKKGKAVLRLSKGDTVRVVARHEGWAHVEIIHYTKSGREAGYGWAEETEANFASAGTITQHDYDRHALTRFDPAKAAKLTRKEEIRSGKALLKYPFMGKVWPIIRWTTVACAILSFLYLLITFFHPEGRGDCDHVFLPVLGVMLGMAGACSFPHWYLMLVYPFLWYIVCYPLLLTKAAALFKPLYYSTSITMTYVYLFALFFAHDYSGLEWLWYAFLFFLLGCVAAGIFVFISTHIDSHLCPRCYHYGTHIVTGSHESSSRVYTKHTGYTDTFSHSEYHGNTKVDYYNREHHYGSFRDITTYVHYQCCKCRGTWMTHSTRTVSA